VLPSPSYVVSDTHLGVANQEVARSMVAFLQSLRGRAGSLIINGDLFDFWFEWRTVIPRPAFRVLAALADLVDDGTPVLWIAGNHDCWGGDVLTRDAGITYHVGRWGGRVAGWRTTLDHGDGLREKEDRRYRALRVVLRHPLAIRAFRLLHPDFATRLAMGSSHASRTYRARDEGAGLRRVAHEILAGDPSIELLVMGHSHVATLERAPSGGVYANPGSWLDAPTYLRIDDDRIALLRWRESSESECLHAIDRRAEESLAKT
jgi:UDP-2,3-diacylglucosamine hydrolase